MKNLIKIITNSTVRIYIFFNSCFMEMNSLWWFQCLLDPVSHFPEKSSLIYLLLFFRYYRLYVVLSAFQFWNYISHWQLKLEVTYNPRAIRIFENVFSKFLLQAFQYWNCNISEEIDADSRKQLKDFSFSNICDP